MGLSDTATPGPPHPPHEGGNETILLVEDEPAIRRVLKRFMENLGYTVLEAGAGGDAARLAHGMSGRIDLLMTDVVMPDMSGLDLAHDLQSCYPGIRVLFMSGHSIRSIADLGPLGRGAHFIQKPFLMRALGTKIREVLGDGPPVPGGSSELRP